MLQFNYMSQIRTWKHVVLLSITILLWSFSLSSASAQSLPCGIIEAPEYFFDILGGDNSTSVEIEDCGDPFKVTTDPASPYTLEIEGEEIEDGGTAYVVGGWVDDLSIVGEGFLSYQDQYLFRHVGGDYIFVDLAAPVPTESEYREYTYEYFLTSEEAERYLEILLEDLETGDTDRFFYEESGEDIIDEQTGESIQNRYGNFLNSVNNYFDGRKVGVGVGTYTFVIKDIEIILGAQPLWQKVKDFFIKTAFAQSAPGTYVHTITFTIAEEVAEPTGASSVLFLPGIQASRLYEGNNQLWEPNANADVERLAMTEEGESINDVFTEDVIDEVNILPVLQGNIYKGFLEMLDELVDDEVIKDFEPFAYDWRYSVDDVVLNGTKYENEVRSVITAVEELAEDSFSGKVTVIGHSNGGLVAKVLLTELERQGKADLVDKVVFIGTPHLGTPKAIGTILHGYDQQKVGGWVIDDSTAREVIQNMPGAYSLLPSERYLQLADTPVITFAEGVATAPMQGAFGESVEGVTEYKNFLNGLEGRTDVFSDISNPYKTNPYMLQGALDSHTNLDEWEAPANVEVFNLVGVGLQTVRAVEYRNVTERINCIPTPFGGLLCDRVNILRPYAHFTQYGDETVASLSAESVEGETLYFDFEKYREENLLSSRQEHADFTEIDEVQSLVRNLLNVETASLEYVSENQPEFSTEYEVVSIDSPVRIIKEDAQGNKTGVDIVNGEEVVLKEIPGSEYMEFAGTKYAIVPKNNDMKTYLYGEAFGSYTLTTAILIGDEQVVETQLVNATTTPTMVAEYEYSDGVYSTIMTDYDGDGVADLEMTLEGEIIQEPEITFEALWNQITNLQISKSRNAPLLLLVRLAEEAKKLRINPRIADRLSDALLVQLRDTIKQYAKKKWITNDQRDTLTDLINKLINI